MTIESINPQAKLFNLTYQSSITNGSRSDEMVLEADVLKYDYDDGAYMKYDEDYGSDVFRGYSFFNTTISISPSDAENYKISSSPIGVELHGRSFSPYHWEMAQAKVKIDLAYEYENKNSQNAISFKQKNSDEPARVGETISADNTSFTIENFSNLNTSLNSSIGWRFGVAAKSDKVLVAGAFVEGKIVASLGYGEVCVRGQNNSAATSGLYAGLASGLALGVTLFNAIDSKIGINYKGEAIIPSCTTRSELSAYVAAGINW